MSVYELALTLAVLACTLATCFASWALSPVSPLEIEGEAKWHRLRKWDVRHYWIRRTRRDWLGRWWVECREVPCCDGRRVLRMPATDPAQAQQLMDWHRAQHDAMQAA